MAHPHVPAVLGTSALFLNLNLADSGHWSSIWEYLTGCGDGEQKARVHLPDQRRQLCMKKRTGVRQALQDEKGILHERCLVKGKVLNLKCCRPSRKGGT